MNNEYDYPIYIECDVQDEINTYESSVNNITSHNNTVLFTTFNVNNHNKQNVKHYNTTNPIIKVAAIIAIIIVCISAIVGMLE